MGFIKIPQVNEIHWVGEAQGGKTITSLKGKTVAWGDYYMEKLAVSCVESCGIITYTRWSLK